MDGKINAKRLGRIANKSTKAGKLNKYFILILRKLSVLCLSSTQDQKRPKYSRENIKTEKYSKILKIYYSYKKILNSFKNDHKNIQKIKINKKISINFERASFSFAGSNNTQIFFLK